MKDTSPSVEARYRAMLLALSPAERLAMATRMFQTAKALAIAGIRAEHGDLSPDELREKLFLRFYGQDFTESEQAKILAHLRKHPG